MEDLAKTTNEQILSRFNTTEDPTVFAEIYNRYHVQLYSADYKGAHLLTQSYHFYEKKNTY